MGTYVVASANEYSMVELSCLTGTTVNFLIAECTEFDTKKTEQQNTKIPMFFKRPPMLGTGSFESPVLTELSLHTSAFFQLCENSFYQRGFGRFFWLPHQFFLSKALRSSLTNGEGWQLFLWSALQARGFCTTGTLSLTLYYWDCSTWSLLKLLLNRVLINLNF